MSGGRRRVRRDGGFTLIEVLAALVVFGLLVAGLSQAVRFGLTAWRVGTETVARDADLDQAARLLTRVLSEARAGPSGGGNAVVGTAGTLVIVTVPGVRLGDPETEFADASLGVEHPQDGPSRLVLRLAPHYHAMRAGPPARPVTIELARGIDHLRLGYYRRADDRWLDSWKAPSPPALFRVEVAFTDPRRHWPPIVAAPKVVRTGQ